MRNAVPVLTLCLLVALSACRGGERRFQKRTDDAAGLIQKAWDKEATGDFDGAIETLEAAARFFPEANAPHLEGEVW